MDPSIMTSPNYRPYFDPETFVSPVAVPLRSEALSLSFDYLDDANQIWLANVGTAVARLYARMVISQPFEVSKFLLQVSRCPSTDYQQQYEIEKDHEEDDIPSYFIDPTAPRALPAKNKQFTIKRPTATELQLVPSSRSVYPELINCNAPYIFDMISAVADKDGPVGLWRALHSSTLYEAASGLLQVWFTGFLTSVLGLDDFSTDNILQARDPLLCLTVTTVASALTHFFLVPVALIRARLIATTFSTSPRSLRASLLGLRSFGRASAIVPTVLAKTLSTAAKVCTPYVLFTRFGIDSYGAPVAFHFGTLFSRLGELLVKIPLDTLAHRAQLNSLDLDTHSLIVIPIPYKGMTSTLLDVVVGRESISGLYRGWRSEVLGAIGEWGYGAIDSLRPEKEHF